MACEKKGGGNAAEARTDGPGRRSAGPAGGNNQSLASRATNQKERRMIMTKKRARRGWREGSVYQRDSDGKWVGVLDLGRGPDGKRNRKVFYGDSKTEVMGKLRES